MKFDFFFIHILHPWFHLSSYNPWKPIAIVKGMFLVNVLAENWKYED